MKLFLAILAFALVAQVPFAASNQNSKNDNDDKLQVYSQELLAEALLTIVSRLETVASEIPDTDAYAKYKNQIEEIVKFYNTKTTDDYCVKKAVKIYLQIDGIFDYLREDRSIEARHVFKIFLKHKTAKFEDDYVNATKAAKHPSAEDMLYFC